tara:strand:- start:562 stop:1938 length:1377 start_codon:yes stop_codon:yes gene_type:complete
MVKKIDIKNLFYIFITFHLIIWTLVPTLTNKNLPLDTIEALAWGSNLDWGFNKHPPTSAFLVEIFYNIFGSQDWAYYLLSQLCVIIAFFIVWKLSEDFFKNKINCLISVLLLEGIYFYNYTTPEFNVYISELPFWALTVFFCWKGFRNNKNSDWFLFGFFAGLGILSHYLFIYLLFAIDIFFLYMIFKKKINFKCLISVIPFLLVLLPHIIWLTENNYTTITYGLHRTGTGDQIFLDHFYHPVIFFIKQFGIIIPFFLLVFLLVSKFKFKLNLKDQNLLFLLTINIIPVFLIFLTSMILGVKIRTMWMTPFYLFLGLLFVYIFQKQINLNKIKSFILTFIILFILSPFSYSYVSITKDNKRTDYPGKEIAELVERRWSKNFSNEIKYVIGDEWHAGNLSYHLISRPIWFENIENKTHNLDINGGVVYTGNAEVLKQVCPGIYGKIKNQGFCMIGNQRK